MNPNPQYPGPGPGFGAGPAAQQRTPGIAIAALIFGIVGVCLPCPFGLVGLILGIVALSKIGSDPSLGGKPLAIIAIAAPLLGVVVAGMMAAIAIPNYLKFEARSKQSECKSNLKAAFTAERSYFAEKDTFSPRMEEVGFMPERGNRYAYFFGRGPVQDRSSSQAQAEPEAVAIAADTHRYKDTRSPRFDDIPKALAGGVQPGIEGDCPECTFTAVCVGNIDNDGTLDVWSVSTEEREGPGGVTIAPGEPYNDVSDVNQ